ncbi:MAG: disulfide bond formation protein DsbA [Comamonadaceae bacterium CG12_big_fil_rev_8_21_14_0_65_59_15]|nr:MAG: disulfide bond formation protein DsbA [Comamonadaceae bacterium CG12_big_fil_rev_8_21_14_0_65_59_15]
MTTALEIEFVSDVACPWCAIGLSALGIALQRLAPDITAHVRFCPFELNPTMGPEGQDLSEHLTQKYGSTPAQQAEMRATIRARGAAVGFAFHPDGRGRISNTFDAHRLLHWAGVVQPERQWALKMALLQACHGAQQPMNDTAVLVQAAQDAGLDGEQARQVLTSAAYTDEVRAQEAHYLQLGIQSVPATLVNGRHLISGGQPPEAFEQALRQIAAAR